MSKTTIYTVHRKRHECVSPTASSWLSIYLCYSNRVLSKNLQAMPRYQKLQLLKRGLYATEMLVCSFVCHFVRGAAAAAT